MFLRGDNLDIFIGKEVFYADEEKNIQKNKAIQNKKHYLCNKLPVTTFLR
ncbi:hypothetical protein JCM15908A_17850 [Prevotella dentasini JCM 15908]